MQQLLTPGFHHLSLVSRDGARTLRFYRDLLGLDLVGRAADPGDPDAPQLYLGMDGGRPGTLLAILQRPDAPRGQWGVGGIHHLALGVDDVTGLLKWKRRLKDAGVSSSGPIDRGYFTSLYFADPDGQVLEIATKGPGYAIDEPPDALGRELIRPPAERLRSHRDAEAIRAAIHPEPVPDVTPDMRLRGIHHVSGITDDLERAHDFYAAALGLNLVKKTFNQDDESSQHWFWARYDGGEVGEHSALTLFGWPGSDFLTRPGVGQTRHVAFRAADGDEQLAWREHLLGMGIDVTPVLDRKYFRSIYFQAPDGLLLEIATDAPGFALEGDAGRELARKAPTAHSTP